MPIVNDPSSSRVGFVYCLTNKHIPNLVKVGSTRKHPIQRAKELSASTGVPDDYRLAYFQSFGDCFAAENLTHQHFDSVRANQSREFFRVDIDEVIGFLQTLSNSPAYRARLNAETPNEVDDIRGGDRMEKNAALAREWRTVADVKTPMAELFASFPDDGEARELTEDEKEKCRLLAQSL